MSKQEEIKQLLIDHVKFTERMESTSSYNLADSSVTRLQSIEERIVLLVPGLLEENERLRKELEESHAYRKSIVQTMFEVDEILRWHGPSGWAPARSKIMGWLEASKDSGHLGQEGEGNHEQTLPKDIT